MSTGSEAAEAIRLDVLRSYTVLDTGAEPCFDRITALAARVLDVPMAVISFTDRDRHWFKAAHGLAGGGLPRPAFAPDRDAETGTEPVAIADLAQDSAFASLPIAAGAPQARFYAEAPIITPCGHHLGRLAVFDTRPRADLAASPGLLADLAATVVDLLQARRTRNTDTLADSIAIPPTREPLTGLASRDTLRQQLGVEIATRTDGRSLALLVVELDGLEPLVDALGHPGGDQLLRQVADRLRAAAPDNLLTRFAGGGFAVVQAGRDDERNTIALARRLIRILGTPYTVAAPETGDRPVSFTVAIGIAPALDQAISPDQLVRNARVASSRARGLGGGYQVFEGGMGSHAERRQAIHLDLGGALGRDEFRLVYQPQMDLRSGQITAFEALLRWQHPTRGLVSPAEFIPVAESGGLIDEIGIWVLHQACQDAMLWPDTIAVSVNLSPVQFRAGWLPAIVRRALDATGLDAARLELEITESVLLPDSDSNIAMLRELRAMGVRIAMDDFGAGHASFAYLRSFAFDKIKIDQQFIRDTPQRNDCGAILRAITGLARDLGVITVGEGVENHAQLNRLRAESCDHAQGFLFSHPVPLKQVPAVIAAYA